MSKYIGEATAYDKKLMLERKEPLSWPAVHEGRLSVLFVLLVQYAHKGGR